MRKRTGKQLKKRLASQPKNDMAPSKVLSAQSLLHPWDDNKPTRRPTPKEVDEYNQIQYYWFLHSGINVVWWYPLNEASIIVIITFTPFEKLTPSPKDDLNFISTFLHNFKRLAQILQQGPNCWYIKQFGPEDQIAFNSHYCKYSWVGECFKKLAHEPFQKNHNLKKIQPPHMVLSIMLPLALSVFLIINLAFNLIINMAFSR
ncbi:hypothetical protein VP01_142g19 [Puccinia sorghi]|uniref:Uncharacterized protein n=1 Tax=Puccinia sorghi TaxID=27349 RepID=A0A0L6VKM8_9BASI|nr:hypothetical protein VP01_142g19 [Puccinia sorghi]